jgi:hypothetical protein
LSIFGHDREDAKVYPRNAETEKLQTLFSDTAIIKVVNSSIITLVGYYDAWILEYFVKNLSRKT